MTELGGGIDELEYYLLAVLAAGVYHKGLKQAAWIEREGSRAEGEREGGREGGRKE